MADQPQGGEAPQTDATTSGKEPTAEPPPPARPKRQRPKPPALDAETVALAEKLFVALYSPDKGRTPDYYAEEAFKAARAFADVARRKR